MTLPVTEEPDGLRPVEWTLAERIRKVRSLFEMEQPEFGALFGVTEKAISTWETGRNQPRNLVKFAQEVERLAAERGFDGDVLLAKPMGLAYTWVMEKITVPKLAEQVPDEEAAYKLLEEWRWGDRPFCPHCGSVRTPYFLTPKADDGRKTRRGKATHRRVFKCADCRKQFTVTTNTIMHGSHIPVRTWLMVMFEMAASKNGVAAREIERKYGLTPKSAWFMTQRVREAMKRDPLAGLLRGTVVADETFFGGKLANKHVSVRAGKDGRKPNNKTAVLSLVHPATGEVRSQVVPNVRGKTLRAAIEANVDLPRTVLHTDTGGPYQHFGWRAAGHETVNHTMSEYVRDDVTTNHAEGYFSQLKRSIDGTHHHVSREHLPRYLAEFDYRYSTRKLTDTERTLRLIGQTGGRRLSYKPLTEG